MLRSAYLKTFLKAAISLTVVALLVIRLDFQVIGDVFRHMHMAVWGVALFFMICQILALATRWFLFVNLDGEKISYTSSLQITLASLLANFLLITSISGVFVRVALTVQHGMSFLKCVCAAVADRLMTLFALVVLAAVFMPLLAQYMDEKLYNMIGLTMALFVFLLFVFAPLFFQGVLRSFVLSNRKVAASLHYMRRLSCNPVFLLKIVAVSLVAQMSYFMAIHFIAVSTGAEFSFIDLLTVLPVITLIASLPISFGGWGVREGAFVYGLGLIGVPMEIAFLISVQIGLLSIFSTFLAGLPILLKNGVMQSLIRQRTLPAH